ncbi:MAG TPA: CsgG/HfaB family protein [Tepidisphaeraceae bacterium]|jgi:curli biogenesis system outer membrane secretion channel CsgG|nr:CsgG/HfaB family protein [Tepidisphaeraceae bacterium]
MFGKAFVKLAAGAALCVVGATACSHSSESASRDTLTANVGQYPPGPSGVNKPRVGVPPFDVTTAGGFSMSGDPNNLAADQMTTLLDQSERFAVIERAQLNQLLKEQNLEGIVRSAELAKQGQVRGVDYLLLGKVTNLRVKTEKKGNSFGLAQLGNIAGGAEVNNSDTEITTECGVDIRLVDPTTGEMMTSNFSEFKRTDSAGSMGVAILGANAQSSADIQLSEDDKGKILRLALDDSLRKSLPKIDKFLRNQPAKTADSAAPVTSAPPANNPPPASGGNAAPANTNNAQVAGKKFCPNCGTANPIDAKFCSKCGAKLD